MTETGHGSNVQALRTTATYDPDTQEFVVNTPDDDARKDYIGNAARDGRLAVVFAQLITGGEERGVHALLVPIRDESGEPCDGVRIEDCGAKLGLNGVDNGRIWFDQVRVPRENLLDKLAQVHEDGTYFSPIENPTRRFFTMLGHAHPGPHQRRRRVDQRVEGGADDRGPARARAAPVRRARRRAGSAADGLPHASAAAADPAGEDVRAVVHPAAARPGPARRVHRRGHARARAARAGDARRGREGDRDLARHGHDPGLPRGVRRRGLPALEPVRRR